MGNIISDAISSVKETRDVIIGAQKYTIEKLGDGVVRILRGGETVFLDTEQNLAKLGNNIVSQISNVVQKSEEDVVYGLRSGIEKGIHLADNQLDQLMLLIQNIIRIVFDYFQIVMWTVLSLVLILLMVYGDTIIKAIIDLIKGFKIAF